MNPTPGTYEAFIDIMDAAGGYPVTRAEVIHAIRQGVRDAFTDHLTRHPEHANPTQEARPATPTLPPGFRPYGSHDSNYLPALESFCNARGYTAVDADWQCLRRLANPRHKCSHDADDNWQPFNSRTLDHLVRLKARDGSHWALLGQPYDLDPALADQLVTESGADRWELCGPAPYGHGTHAVLIVGRGEDQR